MTPREAPSELRLLALRARKVLRQKLRRLRGTDRRVVTLEPAGARRGRVLFSYILDPFLLAPGAPVPDTHTQYWESLEMARAWTERGYAVDAISWLDHGFVPRVPYDFLIDVRDNLERLAPLVRPGCVKVFHVDSAHYTFHNAAEARRLAQLKQRRGIALRPRRTMRPNSAIETADCATVLGNGFTMDTYAFAKKPMYRVPLSTPAMFPWWDDKDFEAAARSFVWLGSGGLVHKGLDLVLEAFHGLPRARLTVCGPVEHEHDFARAFRRELYQTANIATLDWTDVTGPAFAELARSSIAAVYPSSSEGGGGGVITCMHAGLIPVVTREASIDTDAASGVLLEEPSVEAVRSAVERVVATPAQALREMARRTWEQARANHTRERFAREYRRALDQIEARFR